MTVCKKCNFQSCAHDECTRLKKGNYPNSFVST